MTLACPRDAARLEVVPGSAALGHRCPSCEGAMVPQAHFMRSTGHDSRVGLATVAGLASLRNPSKFGSAVNVASEGLDVAGFIAEAAGSIVDLGS